MNSERWVVTAPAAEGERFAILHPDRLPLGPFPARPEDRREAAEEYLRSIGHEHGADGCDIAGRRCPRCES